MSFLEVKKVEQQLVSELKLPRYSEISEDNLRDRIVILGRQRAGKTVYLSQLYHLCWSTNQNLKMKALVGAHHDELMSNVTTLSSGKWPPATASNREIIIEIQYKTEKRLMAVMDYSGEIIKKAFIQEDGSVEVNELLEHLDKAASIILLIDPQDIASPKADHDSLMDNEFAIIQAINRVYGYSNSDNIPIVLAFTKYDLNRNLIKQHGGTLEFTKKYFPKLISVAKNLKICNLSAVQSNEDNLPNSNSKPHNLLAPLEFCIGNFINLQNHNKATKKRLEYIKRQTGFLKKQELKNKLINYSLVAVVVGFFIYLFYYIFSFLWPYLLQKWIPITSS